MKLEEFKGFENINCKVIENRLLLCYNEKCYNITKVDIWYQKVITMIRIKLSELLGKNKMTRKALAELVGVRPNTIGDLYNESVKRIDIEVINDICNVLDCDLSDLLEYVKDDEYNEKVSKWDT